MVNICILGKQSWFVKFPPDLNFHQIDTVLSENRPQGFGLRCLLLQILFFLLRTGFFFFVLSETQYPWTNEGAVNGIYDSVLRKKLFPSDGSYFIILMFLTIFIFVDVLEKNYVSQKDIFNNIFLPNSILLPWAGTYTLKPKPGSKMLSSR